MPIDDSQSKFSKWSPFHFIRIHRNKPPLLSQRRNRIPTDDLLNDRNPLYLKSSAILSPTKCSSPSLIPKVWIVMQSSQSRTRVHIGGSPAFSLSTTS